VSRLKAVASEQVATVVLFDQLTNCPPDVAGEYEICQSPLRSVLVEEARRSLISRDRRNVGDWAPGRQRIRELRSQYSVPFAFLLRNKSLSGAPESEFVAGRTRPDNR
jgi:hypothetical protein